MGPLRIPDIAMNDGKTAMKKKSRIKVKTIPWLSFFTAVYKLRDTFERFAIYIHMRFIISPATIILIDRIR